MILPGYVGVEFPGNSRLNALKPPNNNYDNAIEYVWHNIFDYADIISVYFNNFTTHVHKFILNYDYLYDSINQLMKEHPEYISSIYPIINYKDMYDNKLTAVRCFFDNYQSHRVCLFEQTQYNELRLTFTEHNKIIAEYI